MVVVNDFIVTHVWSLFLILRAILLVFELDRNSDVGLDKTF